MSMTPSYARVVSTFYQSKCHGGLYWRYGRWAQVAKNYFSLSRSRLGHMTRKLNANGVIVKALLLMFWTRKNCRDIVGNRPLCWLVEVENYWPSFTTTRWRGKEDSVWHAYSSWSMCPSISGLWICVNSNDGFDKRNGPSMAVRSTSTFLTVVLHGCLLFFKARDPWLSHSRLRRTGMFLFYYMRWCFPVYVQVYQWRWWQLFISSSNSPLSRLSWQWFNSYQPSLPSWW